MRGDGDPVHRSEELRIRGLTSSGVFSSKAILIQDAVEVKGINLLELDEVA